MMRELRIFQVSESLFGGYTDPLSGSSDVVEVVLAFSPAPGAWAGSRDTLAWPQPRQATDDSQIDILVDKADCSARELPAGYLTLQVHDKNRGMWLAVVSGTSGPPLLPPADTRVSGRIFVLDHGPDWLFLGEDHGWKTHRVEVKKASRVRARGLRGLLFHERESVRTYRAELLDVDRKIDLPDFG